MIQPNYDRLDEYEQKTLKEAEPFVEFSRSPVWDAFQKVLTAKEAEAYEAIIKSQSSSPRVAQVLAERLKARREMRQAIVGFVQSHVNNYRDLVEKLADFSEHDELISMAKEMELL